MNNFIFFLGEEEKENYPHDDEEEINDDGELKIFKKKNIQDFGENLKGNKTSKEKKIAEERGKRIKFKFPEKILVFESEAEKRKRKRKERRDMRERRRKQRLENERQRLNQSNIVKEQNDQYNNSQRKKNNSKIKILTKSKKKQKETQKKIKTKKDLKKSFLGLSPKRKSLKKIIPLSQFFIKNLLNSRK